MTAADPAACGPASANAPGGCEREERIPLAYRPATRRHRPRIGGAGLLVPVLAAVLAVGLGDVDVCLLRIDGAAAGAQAEGEEDERALVQGRGVRLRGGQVTFVRWNEIRPALAVVAEHAWSSEAHECPEWPEPQQRPRLPFAPAFTAAYGGTLAPYSVDAVVLPVSAWLWLIAGATGGWVLWRSLCPSGGTA